MSQGNAMEHAAILERIQSCLATVQAMDLESLARETGIVRDSLVNALDRLLTDGAVEVLPPIGSPARSRTTDESFRERNLYYRLVRETDNDYAWEQDVVLRLPPHHLQFVREVETGAVAPLRGLASALGTAAM